ncbi:MAG: ABC transporter ATP-binding protein, partial [Acidimicrobiales bacterium]|nr:ABC transporter ATP-binding protein [Acidimicrobiales bacterium]
MSATAGGEQMTGTAPILELEDVEIALVRHGKSAVPLVTGVDLTVRPGEAVAIVGESGSGKSLTALSCLGLLPDGVELSAGKVSVGDQDLGSLRPEELRRLRGRRISMIFQDPMTSLDPCFSIGSQIAESVLAHSEASRAQARRMAVDMLGRVGIPDPQRRFDSYPHEFSGGMRQRVMIAMALITRPEILIADEPTTALDVTVQAQILELLRALQANRGMSILLITHDLGVVAENADVVAVMYAGRVVEYGNVHDVFREPLHPYTRGLFASMPVLGRHQDRLETIPGN